MRTIDAPLRRIEWPVGSGVVALYAPHEERFVRSLIDGADDAQAVAREVAFLHELKATLKATLLL